MRQSTCHEPQHCPASPVLPAGLVYGSQLSVVQDSSLRAGYQPATCLRWPKYVRAGVVLGGLLASMPSLNEPPNGPAYSDSVRRDADPNSCHGGIFCSQVYTHPACRSVCILKMSAGSLTEISHAPPRLFMPRSCTTDSGWNDLSEALRLKSLSEVQMKINLELDLPFPTTINTLQGNNLCRVIWKLPRNSAASSSSSSPLQSTWLSMHTRAPNLRSERRPARASHPCRSLFPESRLLGKAPACINTPESSSLCVSSNA